jgi:hypothetical protein
MKQAPLKGCAVKVLQSLCSRTGISILYVRETPAGGSPNVLNDMNLLIG